ncbi:MAG: helix-hairpin-helix domain-containing protein [Anaerolineales bacterium]
MSKADRELNLKPAWWIAYGVVCGLAAAGLILLLVTPRRGQPITLVAAPTLADTIVEADATAIHSPEPTSTFPININVAAVGDLDQLPGIGPSLAQSILAYRDANGRFDSLEELQQVPGIGPRTYEAIKPFITLDDN